MEILISGSYNKFNEGYNSAGVYLWSGLVPSQSFDRPIYYGSSQDFYERHIDGHLSLLRNNHHHNPPLQNYYNKNGEQSLVLFLVEEVEPIREKLLQREQCYLDAERPFADEKRGFNIQKQTILIEYKPRSQETIDRIFASKIKRKYSLVSPLGELFEGEGIRKFCRDQNLNFWSIQSVISDKKLHHKGWRLPKNKDIILIQRDKQIVTRKRLKEPSKNKKQPYIIISPEGKEVFVLSLKDFAAENNLSSSYLNAVINGKAKHHKGWRKNCEENKCVFIDEGIGVNFSLISPNGDIFTEKNICKFARNYNLDPCSLVTVIKGRERSHKGWTRNEEFYKQNTINTNEN